MSIVVIDFDENEFINSIVYSDFIDVENILQEKYANEIKHGSEKERAIYSYYESTFIIDINLEPYYNITIQIPTIKDTFFINYIPSLIDILRCKIKEEIDIANISDADTDIDN